eukprot:TRINITY_DN14582_c0_g1_i1.p1 TRINITY_DN14582_c0_g1~~TRINITY_DN14582_c0_g1_i1.p1  ORF type:complete len:521 (+),score=99.46 TRINITY_DN14582_c0_g1_i1:45-1607(+)
MVSASKELAVVLASATALVSYVLFLRPQTGVSLLSGSQASSSGSVSGDDASSVSSEESDFNGPSPVLTPPLSKDEASLVKELNTSLVKFTQGKLADAQLSSDLYKRVMGLNFQKLSPEIRMLLAQWLLGVHGALVSSPASFADKSRFPENGQVAIPELTRARLLLTTTFPYSIAERRERVRMLLEVNWKLQDVAEMKRHFDTIKSFVNRTTAENIYMFFVAAHVARFDDLVRLGETLEKTQPAVLAELSNNAHNPAVFDYPAVYRLAASRMDLLPKISFNNSKMVAHIKCIRMHFKTLHSKDRKSIRNTIRGFVREVVEFPLPEVLPLRRSGAVARLAFGIHEPQIPLFGFMNENYILLQGSAEVDESGRKMKTIETLELVRDPMLRHCWRGVSIFEKEKISGNVPASEEQTMIFDVEFQIDMHDATYVEDAAKESEKPAHVSKPLPLTTNLDANPSDLLPRKSVTFKTAVNSLFDGSERLIPLDPSLLSKKRIATAAKESQAAAPASPSESAKPKKNKN